MGKRVLIFLSFFILACNFECFSQKTLEIVFTRFGKLKRYELHVGDVLDYKLKKHFSYRRNKITNLQDSMIVFANDSVIKLGQLKAVRIHKNIHLVRTFQAVFIGLGGAFVFLNTTNNLINERSPVLDPRAVLIGGALVGTGILIKQLNVRRVRINGNKYLKIVDLSFNNLSEKPENK